MLRLTAYSISLLLAGLIWFDAPAWAHVKWFVDQDTATVSGFQPYSFTDPVVLIWIGIAIVLVGISIVLDRILPTIPIVDSKTRHDFIEMLRIFTGMSFLLTAYEGALVAPHLVAHGTLGAVLVFLQAGIGILLIANRFIKSAAILTFGLYAGIVAQFGLLSAAEYMNVFGIAMFLLLNNLTAPALQERFKPYSVDMLRIFTGIALVTLGVSEKLYGAMLGQAFLAEYQWNFMAALGVEFFTDRLFVLSAGVMEVVFGTILILGTVTRLNMLAISGLMLTSNIVFLVQKENTAALIEFVGHLPIIATALVLILLGYGQRLKITKLPGAGQEQTSSN
ncbi:MAG: hypothetical protein AAF439_01685 [Pseudomonadota bacterium]